MNLNKILPALYVINKHAKKFSDKARRAYKSQSHTDADLNSEKKSALYETKHDVLLHIHPQADDIKKHHIDGTKYYYIIFNMENNEWKFHIPTNKISINNSRVSTTEKINSFTKDSTVELTDMTLQTALKTINTELKINPNKHISNERNKWPYVY